MPRTNGSDDLASFLTKREIAAIRIMAALMGGSGASPDTKHLAFVSVAAADALFDELAEE